MHGHRRARARAHIFDYEPTVRGFILDGRRHGRPTAHTHAQTNLLRVGSLLLSPYIMHIA